jgi:hypothetical protein
MCAPRQRPQTFRLLRGILSALSLGGLLSFTAPIGAPSQTTTVSQGFETCKDIADNDARLGCIRSLLPSPDHSDRAPSPNSWPLLRTPHPNGGPDAISVLRTADTARSDPDLAGLMLRCPENNGTEVLLAFISPIPPKTKKTVVLSAGNTRFSMKAEAIASGAALLLPDEATALANGPWQDEESLGVIVEGPENETRGYIPLDGLSVALRNLRASCATR